MKDLDRIVKSIRKLHLFPKTKEEGYSVILLGPRS